MNISWYPDRIDWSSVDVKIGYCMITSCPARSSRNYLISWFIGSAQHVSIFTPLFLHTLSPTHANTYANTLGAYRWRVRRAYIAHFIETTTKRPFFHTAILKIYARIFVTGLYFYMLSKLVYVSVRSQLLRHSVSKRLQSDRFMARIQGNVKLCWTCCWSGGMLVGVSGTQEMTLPWGPLTN